MILAEYQKKHHLYLHQDYYFWQDSNGHEVDLLVQKNQGFAVFEVKATHTISEVLFREINRFKETRAPATITKTNMFFI